MTKLIHADVTEKARRAYYTTYNRHAHDYPESFYEEIMRLEFSKMDVVCKTQVEYEIYYKNTKVGVHITDTELDDKVILEYKVVSTLLPIHYAQLISYLKVSGKEVGLLFNFGGEEVEIERRVLTATPRKDAIDWQPENEAENLRYPEITSEVRRAMWEVGRTLGAGFIQRIYCNAAFIELKMRGIVCEPVKKLIIFHDGYEIGDITFRHFIVESKIALVPVAISEIKPTLLRKVRMVMVQRGLKFGVIANFASQPVEVRYIW